MRRLGVSGNNIRCVGDNNCCVGVRQFVYIPKANTSNKKTFSM